MSIHEEPELICHWKAVDVDPSGSMRFEREADRELPSAGVPEMASEAVAGSSILATAVVGIAVSDSLEPCWSV